MQKTHGFTIVELLVVIVVIGILAAITIVSYTGVSQKATASSLQSDLTNSSNKLKMYQAEYGSYPTMGLPDSNGMICPTAPNNDTRYCLKASPNNTYAYYPSNGTTFRLVESNANGATYSVTESRSPSVTIATTDTNWLVIGSQLWAKANLNVGTMVPGTLGQPNTTDQTNNATLEKYCYLNDPANCTTYGGLYQWDEAMQYVTTEGAQGICPAGSHIPTDAEWTTLVTYLGGPTAAGAKLKSGGSSGLDMPLAGYRVTGGSFGGLLSSAYLWSSSESGASAWYRDLYWGSTTVIRDTGVKGSGFSVRCLGN